MTIGRELCALSCLLVLTHVFSVKVHDYDSQYCPAFDDTSHCATVDPPMPPSKGPVNSVAPTFTLSQADFNQGTLQLKQPGYYTLTENVLFRPNPDDGFGPRCPQQPMYCNGPVRSAAYQQGFFSALTMEGHGIHLNLGGYSIGQHAQHALQQGSTFALIQLNNQPLHPDNSASLPSLSSCKECSISNGNLGRSSGHGIHAIMAEDIQIHDIVLQDYETSAVTCDGCKRVELSAVQALGTFRSVPLKMPYTQALLNLGVWDRLKQTLDPQSLAYVTINNRAQQLRAKTRIVAASVLLGLGVGSDVDDMRLFSPVVTEKGTLPDRNTYGIRFQGATGSGGAAQSVFAGVHSESISSDIHLFEVHVTGTYANPLEVIGIKDDTTEGRLQKDMAGGIIRISDIKDSNNEYVSDLLHEFLFTVAFFSDTGLGNDPALTQAKMDGRLGTLNIDAALVSWAKTSNPFPSYLPLVCNIDGFGNTITTSTALSIRQTYRFDMQRSVIQKMANYAQLSSAACGNTDTSYKGSHMTAISVSAASELVFNDFDVSSVASAQGSAYGMHVHTGVRNICLNDGVIGALYIDETFTPTTNSPKTRHHTFVAAGVHGMTMTALTMSPHPNSTVFTSTPQGEPEEEAAPVSPFATLNQPEPVVLPPSETIIIESGTYIVHIALIAF